MSSEKFRPALAPAILGLSTAFLAIALIAGGLVYVTPQPAQMVAGSLLFLIVGVLYVIVAGRIVFLYFTQSYEVASDVVRMAVGVYVKQAQSIDRRNIAKADAVMPFPYRLFGIGNVQITTTDGSFSQFLYVKDPARIVKLIEPSATAGTTSTSA